MELNTIQNINCLDGIKLMPDNSVDLVWTSPPYFDIHKYSDSPQEIGYGQDYDSYITSLIALFEECNRALKPSGNLVVNIMDLVRKNKPLLISNDLIAKVKSNFVERIVWSIRNKMPVASNVRVVNKMEWIIRWSTEDKYFCDIDSAREPHSEYAAKDKRKWKWNSKGKNCGNVWDIPSYRVSGKNKVHQAGFPMELCDRVIKLWCPENGVVLDPFMGSGATAVSAVRNNRRFIGFELSKVYYEASLERVGKEILLTSS